MYPLDVLIESLYGCKLLVCVCVSAISVVIVVIVVIVVLVVIFVDMIQAVNCLITPLARCRGID